MTETANFRRGDGVEFSAEVGSASFDLMAKTGGFERIWPAGEAPEQTAEPNDLSGLTLKALQEMAVVREIPISKGMKKAEIIELLKSLASEPSSASSASEPGSGE